MRKLTRRDVREFLLQALYARTVLGESFLLSNFIESYYQSPTDQVAEDAYFLEAFSGIIEYEGILLAITERYAKKFDPSIMPVVNLLPIFIAAYEMLYLKADTVPEKVSINEAVELAKRFSDDGARELVNGVLNHLKDEKETVLSVIESRPRLFFL